MLLLKLSLATMAILIVSLKVSKISEDAKLVVNMTQDSKRLQTFVLDRADNCAKDQAAL